MTTEEKVKEIKQSFRLLMDGVASRSMREKGLDYHINWGVSLPHLREMAAGYGQDMYLAIELWKENIRECKILATMIMPPEEADPQLLQLWVEQVGNQEIAEMLAFNLVCHTSDALVLAKRWIATDEKLSVIVGLNTISRLITMEVDIGERDLCEIRDQAQAALGDESLSVRHAANNLIVRLEEM